MANQDNNTTLDILKVAAGIVLIPMAIGAVWSAGCTIVEAVGGLIERIRYNKKIKDGLAKGSIVEIDGQFYEVEYTVEEA